MGGIEEMIFRNKRPPGRSFPSRKPHWDRDGSSGMNDTPAFDMTDRSTAFATDHGSASWLRTPSKATTSRRRGDEADVDLNSGRDSQYSASDLGQLYVRHPPTLYSVRKALLKAKGNLNPRSIVELEGKRPPSAYKTTGNEGIRPQKPTWSPNSAIPTSSSPFSVNASSADITVLRQQRQGRHTIMVPVPFSVPRSKLAAKRPDLDGGWNTPETLTAGAGTTVERAGRFLSPQSKKRSTPSDLEHDPPSSASRAGVGGSQTPSQPRSKGMTMFKKLKR